MEISCEKCSSASKRPNIHESSDIFTELPRVLILYVPRSAPYYSEEVQRTLFRKNRVKIDVDVVLSVKDLVSSEVNKSKLATPNAKCLGRKREFSEPDDYKFSPPKRQKSFGQSPSPAKSNDEKFVKEQRTTTPPDSNEKNEKKAKKDFMDNIDMDLLTEDEIMTMVLKESLNDSKVNKYLSSEEENDQIQQV
jgi:hypothetical protein